MREGGIPSHQTKGKFPDQANLVHRLISGRHTVGFKRVWMLVSCPRNSRYIVAIKMGRRQGARREHI